MNNTLKGKWAYRSFYHAPIVVNDNKIDGDPQLAMPWTPPGELHAETDDQGNVTASLTFAGGAALTVTGRIIPATEKAPASVELTGDGLSAIYKIKGFFIPGSNHIVGTVINMLTIWRKCLSVPWGLLCCFHLKLYNLLGRQHLFARYSNTIVGQQ